jgi:uncharacterized membrane protein YkvA (DUF1232 family)
MNVDDTLAKWRKAAIGLTKKAGEKLIEDCLLVVEVAKDTHTPIGVRLVIVTAIAYVLNPVDVVPDIFIGGYADDATAIAACRAAASGYITDEIQRRAQLSFKRLQQAATSVVQWFRD